MTPLLSTILIKKKKCYQFNTFLYFKIKFLTCNTKIFEGKKVNTQRAKIHTLISHSFLKICSAETHCSIFPLLPEPFWNMYTAILFLCNFKNIHTSDNMFGSLVYTAWF